MIEGKVYNLSCIDEIRTIHKKCRIIKNAPYWKKQYEDMERRYNKLLEDDNSRFLLIQALDKIYELESIIEIKNEAIKIKNIELSKTVK
jgi:hypothetical protein